MPGDDPPLRYTTRLRSLDEFPAPEADCLAPHDTGHVQPRDRADRDVDQGDFAAKDDGQQDDEEDEGNGIEDVDDAHHGAVDSPADEAGGSAPQRADDHA